MKAEISKFFTDVGKQTKEHAPEILASAAVIGAIGTFIFAIKAAPKAQMLIEERKYNEGKEKLNVKETIETVWKPYCAPVAILMATCTAMIFSCKESCRQKAALAAAATLLQNNLSAITEEAKAVLKPNQIDKLKGAVAEKKVAEYFEKHEDLSEVVETSNGKELCLDITTGVLFTTSKDFLERKQIEYNHRLSQAFDETIELQDWMQEIGEAFRTDHDGCSGKVGQILGFESSKLIDIYFSSTLSEKYGAIMTIDYTDSLVCLKHY